MNAKNTVLSCVTKMPEDSTIAEIRREIDRIDILDAIHIAQVAAQKDQTMSHEEVTVLYKTWTEK